MYSYHCRPCSNNHICPYAKRAPPSRLMPSYEVQHEVHQIWLVTRSTNHDFGIYNTLSSYISTLGLIVGQSYIYITTWSIVPSISQSDGYLSLSSLSYHHHNGPLTPKLRFGNHPGPTQRPREVTFHDEDLLNVPRRDRRSQSHARVPSRAWRRRDGIPQ